MVWYPDMRGLGKCMWGLIVLCKEVDSGVSQMRETGVRGGRVGGFIVHGRRQRSYIKQPRAQSC